MAIPDGISKTDIEKAIRGFERGAPHRFRGSTKYDLIYKGKRYPPKAIIGLAAKRVAGRVLEPRDFTGGEDSKCFKILRAHGFKVGRKVKGQPKATGGASAQNSRNPSWHRDELILALDLYFREADARGVKTHQSVVELSRLLRNLPIHPLAIRTESFRNPSSVAMKLSNFLGLDDAYPGSGLASNARSDRAVWDEFSNNRNKLKRLAKAIREGKRQLDQLSTMDIDYEEDAEEGGVLTRLHKVRERNRKLVDKKKTEVLKRTGKLACEVCNFDFFDRYGERGFNFAECHHDRPLSDLAGKRRTKLANLRIVCSNCHRMIHRKRPWLSVDELRAALN